MELISQTLRESLCAQWVHEKENASIYLFIGGYLRNKGLDNIAKIFISGASEEDEHAKMIFDLLTDLNTSISINSIPSGDFQINTIKDIADKFLEREILTTAVLQKIRDIAITDTNGVVEEFLRGMIQKQTQELEESSTFADKAELLPEWWQVALWNESLG